MPGPAHETLVEIVRSHPAWFNALLKELGLAVLPAQAKVADAAVRVIDPVEVRLDVLLIEGEKRGPWTLIEFQRDDDPAKQRRWLVGAAALFDQRGEMGDVIVVTHVRSVAGWARTIACVEGPRGTQLALRPVVVLLTRRVAEALLATGRPELAVFAAWAVHHQRGAPAIKVVKRAVATAQKADSKTLQDALIQAILNMLDGELRKVVHKMLLDFSKIPEGPVHKYVREQFEKRGRAQGEAEALLRVLAKRGLAIDDATRERVLACTDETTLDRWIDRAITAASAAEVFGETAAKGAVPVKKKRARRSRAR